jgi:hypothetical protein
MNKSALWLAGLLVIAGCALKPKYLVEQYNPPAQVAVLPLDNQTNDLDGPEMVRQLMQQYLPQRGYDTIPLEEIDEKLRSIGITDGGQLGAVKFDAVGTALGVDGLIYGQLIDFDEINIGVYSQKKVQAQFTLISAETGEKLWEDVRAVTTRDFALNADDAKRAFARSIAEKAVTKMLKIHLKAEAEECVIRILSTIPPGR